MTKYFFNFGLKYRMTMAIFLGIILFFVPFSSSAQFSGGDGSENDPYIITTSGQLAQLATYVNESNAAYKDKHYKLDADIDLSDYGENFNDGKGWIPVGHSFVCAFRGHFNGNNKTISNLYIDNSGSDAYSYTGLFGMIIQGSVANLEMENVNVRGKNHVGSVAGYLYSGSIAFSHSSGTVDANSFAGGVAGYVDDCNITDCYSSCSVSSGQYAGGVTSYVIGDITNCYSTGPVSGASNVGGVAGNFFGNMTDCYSSATVFGSDNYVGGVVGSFLEESYMTKCYFTGTVSGSNHFVGGVAGYIAEESSMTKCYSTGDVSSLGNYVGGVVGSGIDCNVTNCYSTGAVSGAGTYVGGVMGDSFNSTLTNSVALNPSVKSANINVGRVTGFKSIYTILSNNAAWEGILNNDNNTTWNNIGAGSIDGADISKIFINTDGTIGGRFTNADGWTIENGKLPGFGAPVEMPEHLRLPLGFPIITTTTLPNGEMGIPYHQSLTAEGDTPLTWSLGGGNLPNGLNLSPNGVISGTPTTAGTFDFTVKVVNNVGSDTKTLAITIENTELPPTITTTNLPNGETEIPYHQTLTAKGDTPLTWSLEGGNLPNGLNLSSNGVISGTPTTTGTFDFTVKVVNNVGSDTKTLEITIDNTMGIFDNSQSQFKVYPNPVADMLKIIRPTTEKAQIEIYNCQGSMIWSFETNHAETEINVSSLPSGVYLIRLIDGGSQNPLTSILRFVKK
ncbi:MAG: putative Ig domain-containing protein [Bacteroidales bacterium]|jgi:hypothetical protein|nr:putative Ig domain-containing protein [Bacteroidales bacterium]